MEEKSDIPVKNDQYENLIEQIDGLLHQGRTRAFIRKLYISFPIGQTLSDQLSWSHYIQILIADNELEIKFYTKQCEKENWSIRELKRQMNSMLFHRLALSKDKAGILAIAEKGAEIQKPEDIYA